MVKSNFGHVRKNGSRYHVEVWTGGKRYRIFTVRGKAIASKAEADRILDDLRLQVGRGGHLVLLLESMTRRRVFQLPQSRSPDPPWKKDYRLRMFNGAKRRAEKAEIEFNLTADDIMIPDLCPVFGTPLEPTLSGGGRSDSAPSIDRLNPALGYTRGNVIVISWKANRLKGTATPAELRRLADWLEYFEHCPPLIDEVSP